MTPLRPIGMKAYFTRRQACCRMSSHHNWNYRASSTGVISSDNGPYRDSTDDLVGWPMKGRLKEFRWISPETETVQ